jgi:hypothetical protein
MSTARQLHEQTNPLSRIVSLNLPFSPSWLTANGFTFMGNCWGNHNSPYWQMETEIGTICVSYREVWLERGHREQRLEKIDCEKMLGLFIGMLS